MQSNMDVFEIRSRIPERKMNLLKTSELVLGQGGYNPNIGPKPLNNHITQKDQVFNRMRVSNSHHHELMTIQPQQYQTLNTDQPAIIPRVRNGQLKEEKQPVQKEEKVDEYLQMMIDPFEFREMQIREKIKKEQMQGATLKLHQESQQTRDRFKPDKTADNFPPRDSITPFKKSDNLVSIVGGGEKFHISDKKTNNFPYQPSQQSKGGEGYDPTSFKPKIRSISTKEQDITPKKPIGNEEEIAVATGVQELEDSRQEEEELFPCTEGCGRSFTKIALEKHMPICKKVFQQKRNEFNVAQQRVVDNEQIKLARTAKLKDKIEGKGKKLSQSKEKSSTWKEESEQLRNVIKQNKLPPKK